MRTDSAMNYRYDFRVAILILSFMPILFLLVVSLSGMFFFRQKSKWDLVVVNATAVIGLFIALKTSKWARRITYNALICKDGVNKEAFLAASFEDPETFHVTKVMADDAGIIFGSNGVLTLILLKARYEIKIDNISMTVIDKGGAAKGVELDFLANGSQERHRLVGQFRYRGSNFRVATNQLLKSQWAIEEMRRMCSA